MTRIVWRIVRRSMSIASVRYRALLPALALQAHGFESRFADSQTGLSLAHADLLVISKSFSHRDIELCEQAQSRGIPVVLDLCDNIFIPDYGVDLRHRPADVFRAMAAHARLVTCPTEGMADIIRAELGEALTLAVIPDSVETPELVRRQASLLARYPAIGPAGGGRLRRILAGLKSLRPASLLSGLKALTPNAPASIHIAPAADGQASLLWFGNHGSAHGNAGLTDILLFRRALEQLAQTRQIRLIVVSNSRARFDELIAPMKLPTLYLEWSAPMLAQALAVADVAIIPNSLDEFSAGKSANRTVLCLQAGVPVVATPTRALEQLQEAVWTGDPQTGLIEYLDKPATVRLHLDEGEKIIKAVFSLTAVGWQWQQHFSGLLK